MPDISLCPSGEELKQFAQGSLAEAPAERVIQHLRSCRTCLAVLEGTPIEDTLIEALQTSGNTARAGDKAEMEGLIQRLKKLAVGAAADPEARRRMLLRRRRIRSISCRRRRGRARSAVWAVIAWSKCWAAAAWVSSSPPRTCV